MLNVTQLLSHRHGALDLSDSKVLSDVCTKVEEAAGLEAWSKGALQIKLESTVLSPRLV